MILRLSQWRELVRKMLANYWQICMNVRYGPPPYPVIGILFLTCIALYSGMPNLSKTHARAIFITHTHHACRPGSVKESIPQGAMLGQGRLGGADETCSLLILT